MKTVLIFALLSLADLARSVLFQRSKAKATQLQYELNQAIMANEAFKVCCGVNKLGALIGGTIASVVVLAAVAALIWMIVAKNACFSGCNSAKKSSHAVQDLGQQLIAVETK